MGDTEDIIRTAAAAKKLWKRKHPDQADSSIYEEMVFGFCLFMMESIRRETDSSLIDALQKGLDRGFEYYMRELDTVVKTASFARLRNLYDFRNIPEEEVIENGNDANLLEAAIWCLITTTTLQQALMKAADLGGCGSDRAAVPAAAPAALYYTAADLPPKWSDVKLERKLAKP